MLRVFTGLPLPAEAVRRLSGPCEALRRGFRGLRVVRPEGLHVTLQFFGEVPEERAKELAGLLTDWDERTSPAFPRIRAVLGGLGQFPATGAPRVLYCPLGAGGEAVGALHAQLQPLLGARGGEGGEQRGGSRDFTPHVTVARSRGGAVDLAAARELFAFEIPVELDRVVLFQSILGPRGAEYRPLAGVLFG